MDGKICQNIKPPTPTHIPSPVQLRGSIHTQTATLNVKLTFVSVWVKMPDVRVVTEMSETNFQNTMCNSSNTK